MDELRDPRAFRVVDDDHGITFPKDDDVLAAILKGSRPGEGTYKTERYRTGQTIPAGRLPLSASAVLEARGVVVAVEAKGSGPAGTAGQPPSRQPAVPAEPDAAGAAAPATATKIGGRP